jgi:DNA-binding Lrp family transcriptional regulator
MRTSEDYDMISAVVLLNTDSGTQDKILESLQLVDGVEEAHALYGVYDLLVKIKGTSIEKLKEITKSQIKPIAGVNSSLTLMIVQGNLTLNPNIKKTKIIA